MRTAKEGRGSSLVGEANDICVKMKGTQIVQETFGKEVLSKKTRQATSKRAPPLQYVFYDLLLAHMFLHLPLVPFAAKPPLRHCSPSMLS